MHCKIGIQGLWNSFPSRSTTSPVYSFCWATTGLVSSLSGYIYIEESQIEVHFLKSKKSDALKWANCIFVRITMSFQALPCEPKCSQCQPGSHAIPIVERSRTCDKQFVRWLEGIEYTLYVAKCVEPLLLEKNLASSSRKSKSHL